MPTDIIDSSFARFHPLVRDWFKDRYGEPTEIQELAWRKIADGDHALISAATGSGKTLAAFLWGISQLVSGEWELGLTRVVYVSPLKALNNDIRRNILEPLSELKGCFEKGGVPWPRVRVETRSGDTPQADRRKMLRHPPEVLITTPESLNLLLTSKDGQRALQGVKTLILDEIHSVVGSKRGVYLMTAVERLAHLNGEFQRIALSATVRPMELVAKFVGGSEIEDGRLNPRRVGLAQSTEKKEYAIDVRFPEEANEGQSDDDFWYPIVQDLKQIIAANDSTLIFVNSRRLCEKITHKINFEEAAPIAYSHHGSLSKEIRYAVEQRLRNGELKAIVATNSLEMGIDIGALDQVVMVQCPGVVSSAIQKVGRAGHQVGAISKATVFPSHSRDFLEAAVLSKAIQERDIEPVRPVECPLDVLAQVIVSMVGSRPWDIDELLMVVKSSYCYRDLQREPFELVLNMLAGRYASSRLRELKPRVSIDRSENTVTIRKGALLAYYFSGGVIPDRGYFHLRMEGSGSRVGELDEEFVWERVIGDTFTLGAQSWKIERITYNDVFVTPGDGTGPMPPFWKSEEFNRDFHYSAKIGEFLQWADERMEEKGFEKTLVQEFAFDTTTAKALAEHLRKQKIATRQPLPHRNHLLAELVEVAPSGAPGQNLILHTHWGGKVNRPFGLALDAAWDERFGHRTEVYVNNDCVVINISEGISVDEALRLINGSNVESMLRRRLESSGFFGARFREASGTSLLITRQKAGQRLPLWLSRMRSKKLLDSVRRYEDFPVILEAWRTCLKDEFDMESLKQVLAELEQGIIEVSVTKTSVASPFAESIAYRQINDNYMYDNDDPMGGDRSKLREDLIQTVAFDDTLRPRVSLAIVQDYESKRQRLAEGYAPSDDLELKEWLRDRIAMRESEWEVLLDQVGLERQASRSGGDIVDFSSGDGRFGEAALPLTKVGGFVFLKEEADRVDALFCSEPDPDSFVEWLSYFGPVKVEWLQSGFPVSQEYLNALLDSLVDDRRMVVGRLVEEREDVFVCEYENFETLLRMQRARNRPVFDPLPVELLQWFLADQQGLIKPSEGEEAVYESLERMNGYVERASIWEEDYLPARVPHYQSAWLDACIVEDQVEWVGVGVGKIAFGFGDELNLLSRSIVGDLDEKERGAIDILAGASGGRFAFRNLLDESEFAASDLESALWSLAWKGRLSNDSFASVRRGCLADFSLSKVADSQNRRRQAASTARVRVGRRARVGNLSSAKAITYPGNWYALPGIDGDPDAIATLELQKERVRVLLDRYGIVFRELLQREAEGFQWKNVFKALRLMELSGEVLAGAFFEGISGLQFASHEAFQRLRKERKGDPVYWMNAADPASLSGIGLDALKGRVPKRLASTRVVFRGSELVLEVLRNGKELQFHIEPDDLDLSQILDVIRHMLSRSFNPVRSLFLETINGKDARSSPYLDSLDESFRLHCDHKRVVLEGVK